jgi:hypothetical protein
MAAWTESHMLYLLCHAHDETLLLDAIRLYGVRILEDLA